MTSYSTERSPDLAEVLKILGLDNAVVDEAIPLATDTQVWRVSHDGRSLAVRLFREERRNAMQAELEAIGLAGEAGLPVPEVLSSALVAGRYPAMALQWLPGDVVGNAFHVRPRLASRLGRSAGQLLARIHRIPVNERSSHSKLGADWIDLWGPLVEPEIRELLDADTDSIPSLLHLDYHPYNLLCVGGRSTGVLDWTNATIGDPRADIARTVSLLQVVGSEIAAERGSRRAPLREFERAFLKSYQESAGALRNLAPFYAWAGAVLAGDLGPKVHLLPVSDHARLRHRIEQWTEYWRSRALEATCQSPVRGRLPGRRHRGRTGDSLS